MTQVFLIWQLLEFLEKIHAIAFENINLKINYFNLINIICNTLFAIIVLIICLFNSSRFIETGLV